MEISQFKALQVTLESAIFESSDFRYYITVELDHSGDRVSNLQLRAFLYVIFDAYAVIEKN